MNFVKYLSVSIEMTIQVLPYSDAMANYTDFFLMINKVIALNVTVLETKSSYSLVLYQTPTISVQIRGNTCQYQLLTIKLRKVQVPKFGYLRSGNHGKIPEYILSFCTLKEGRKDSGVLLYHKITSSPLFLEALT